MISELEQFLKKVYGFIPYDDEITSNYLSQIVFKQISNKDNQDSINLDELIMIIHNIRGIF